MKSAKTKPTRSNAATVGRPPKPKPARTAATGDGSPLLNEMVLPDLDTLRLLSDGLRHRIVSLLIQEPLTVTDLAKRLRVKRTALYYHVELLERHGLVRVDSKRPVGSTTEQTYRAVARHFRVDRSVLSSSSSDVNTTQAAIIESAAADLMTIANNANGNPLVARTFIRLDQSTYVRLCADIRHLLEEYERAQSDRGEPFEIALAVFPIHDAANSSA